MSDGSLLISGYFDGTLADAELAELNAWIGADPEHAKLFAKHALLQSQVKDLLGSERALREASLQAGALEGRGDDAGNAFARESAKAAMLPVEGAAAGRGRQGWWRGRRMAIAAAVAVAAGLLAWQGNRMRAGLFGDDDGQGMSDAPAFITADAGAVIKGNDQAVRGDGDDQRGLRAGEKLTLADGYIEVTFAAGAKVVMQAPATFAIESSTAMTLSSGKLAATVNGGGFVVNTPTAKVKDLGTEFGVSVASDARTQVEVFKGRVQAELVKKGAKPGGAAGTTLLKAGEAAMISSDAIAMDPAGAAPEHFLRSLATVTSSLDVVDLVCGGDGRGYRRGMGIDPFNGDSGALKQFNSEIGDDHFHAVGGVAVMDGCFIPDGSVGANQVDSAGHRFQFPGTSKESVGLLWAGGRTIDPYGDGLARSVLGSVDYSEPEHSILYMYTNKGVTFDLKGAGARLEGDRIYQFRCIVGNTHLKMNHRQRTAPRSDLYVLVDGKLRFERLAFSNHTEPFTVKVRLNEGDRYLTLATTEADDTTLRDCVIVADPTLETMIPLSRSASSVGQAARPGIE